ncbi:hypothetical protein N2152v2_009985 [Parachlorella kessleri]
MEAPGSQSRQSLLPTRFDGTLLVSLPLDVLELVCDNLPLRDRVALTSSCRHLLTRPDLTNSTHLWGAVEVRIEQYASEDYPVSLSQWLARRKAAVGRLLLGNFHGTTELAVMLAGLEGGSLAALDVHYYSVTGANPANSLAPLAHLGTLTELKLWFCGASCLPPQPSALTALKVLDLTGFGELGKACEAAFNPLAAVTQLTALHLKCCELRWLPRQLSALAPTLQVLGLQQNFRNLSVKEEVAGSMQPLSSRTSLTCLELTGCGLPCIPPQVSALGALQRMQLGCSGMTDAEVDDYQPLRQLSSLTFFDLVNCNLQLLQPQLSCLSALAELQLTYNSGLGPSLWGFQPAAADASSWQPLLSLGVSLTNLDVSFCNIAALPDGFSSLSALVSLNLSANADLGLDADTSFRLLSGLVALKVLKLYKVDLRRIPPQLKLLPALEELQLWGNRSLGKQGAALGQQLIELPALESLDLGDYLNLDPSTEEVLKLMVARGVHVRH